MGEAILAVHRLITSNQSEVISDLSPQILQNAFRVPATDFGKGLDVGNSNLVQIEKLSKNSNPVVEINYLKLAVAYILENPDRIGAWTEFDAAASTEAVAGSAETIRDLLLALPAVDQQAMASLRLYAALHSFSDDIMREYLSRNMPSDWTQSRLLYPLIYYSINVPDAHALDQMLAQVFPPQGTGKAERILTRFLLQPDHPETANLALRCYVALISHPYDALEYIVTDLERRCADGEAFDHEYLEQFSRLAKAFPAHRIAKLVKLAARHPLPFSDRPEDLAGFAFPAASHERDTLLSVLDTRVAERPEIDAKTDVMAAIIGFRWSRYPDPKHFEQLFTFHRRYAVLSCARLVRFIATSLYLFGREEPARERLILLQGALVTGQWSPFAASGPQGYSVTSNGRFMTALPPSEAVARTSKALCGEAEARGDRIWIKAANWSLMEAQAEGRVAAWAAAARRKFPVWIHPRYLSGLDWFWLTGVIDALGMRSFMGNVDIVYVLFLKQLEEFRRESMPLRVAIEPVARSVRSTEEMSDWLHAHLGHDSAAFIRYFLNADTIMKLRLTDNYVAAVSGRLDLFERAVRAYDFTPDVFDETDLQREQDVLTAMLCRMSVGARQFEVNWNLLHDNAAERARDAYSAHETVSQAMPDDAIANARRVTTFQFSNGASGDYESRNRDWPLVLVIAGVIDTLLTHPTTGIEAILSVRIRHDNFRREYENAIHDVETSAVIGVAPGQTKRFAKDMAAPLYREVQRWLDNRMHTLRKDKPQALFNFIPTKKDMAFLVQEAADKDLNAIVALVLEWTKPRLEVQLAKVRISLANDLGVALERRIAGGRTETNGKDGGDARRVADAIAAHVSRRTRDLDEWFKVPEGDRDQSLTVGEIVNAVRQRFRMHENSGRLEWNALPVTLGARVVAPAHIRHLYDLLSEIVHNALKHSKMMKTSIRITAPKFAGDDLVFVTNRKMCAETREEEIAGHPFLSLHETLFGEGKSGLKKIAYLSASICGKPTNVGIREKPGYFHLIIPLDAIGRPCGAP